MCCFCRKDTTNSPSSYQKHNNIYTVKTHHSDFLSNRKPRLFRIDSLSLIAESFKSTIILLNHKKKSPKAFLLSVTIRCIWYLVSYISFVQIFVLFVEIRHLYYNPIFSPSTFQKSEGRVTFSRWIHPLNKGAI